MFKILSSREKPSYFPSCQPLIRILLNKLKF
jgi:hypothetical protein